MRLEIASNKAIRVSILKYHYSRKLPVVQIGFSVFNDAGEWCGCICYSLGATNRIGIKYGCVIGQAVELVRVALNGKQESTSKAVAISLKLLKKHCPLVRIVISYADTAQDHIGTLYQASNWFYDGISKGTNVSFIHVATGRRLHKRSVTNTGFTGTGKKCNKKSECKIVPGTDKYKYLYPLDAVMRQLCEKRKQAYPKRGNSSTVEHQANQFGDGVRIDLAAQTM